MKNLKSSSSLLLFLVFILLMGSLSCARVSGAPDVSLLWSNSMEVNDVAVSGDGGYLAVVNSTVSGGALFFFRSESANPIWWWLISGEVPLSVVISYDGGQVALGTSTGYVYYFDNSRTRSGLQASSTWRSRDLGGSIERRTIDIADYGQYVLVGGTGESVYYFAGCRARSTLSEEPTWINYPQSSNDIRAVDLTPDGQCLAVGGSKAGLGGFVAFYQHANTQPYPTSETWNARTEIDAPVTDLKVSDDGHSVVAVTSLQLATLYYWGDAKSLSGDSASTWTSTLPYFCVDMSADGDNVVAGKPSSAPCGIHFWTGAESLVGTDKPETWARHEGEFILDVAISRDGEIIAAVGDPALAVGRGEYWAYFYSSDGVSLGEFQLDSLSDKISMSGDGGTVAVGSAVLDSLYVFKITRPVTVGGELGETEYLSLLAPFFLYGAAVAVGVSLIVAVRRRTP